MLHFYFVNFNKTNNYTGKSSCSKSAKKSCCKKKAKATETETDNEESLAVEGKSTEE